MITAIESRKMKNNLQKIKQTFTEIADAIQDMGIDVNCDPVTKYAEKIRSIPSGSGSGFTSATAYVEEVGQDSPMTADVEIINDTLAFTFGLRAGAPGRDGYDGQDGTPGKDGKNGADGRSVLSIVKKYALGNNPTTPPAAFNTEDPATLTTDYTNNRFIWCEETTNYSDGTDTVIKYIITVHGEPGATGVGTKGPIIYPAGVWNPYSAYTVSDTKVPYVYYAEAENKEDRYWILKKDVVFNADGTNLAPINNSDHWERMESYDAIYSDIGVFNSALVGKFVFAGNYIFSQEGFGSSDSEHIQMDRVYTDYEDVEKAISQYLNYSFYIRNTRQDIMDSIAKYNWFRPNILIDSITGQILMNKAEINSESFQIVSEEVPKIDDVFIGTDSKLEVEVPAVYSSYSTYNNFILLDRSFNLGSLENSDTVIVKAGSIDVNIEELWSSTTPILNTGSVTTIVSEIRLGTRTGTLLNSDLTVTHNSVFDLNESTESVKVEWDEFIFSPDTLLSDIVLYFYVVLRIESETPSNSLRYNGTVSTHLSYTNNIDIDPSTSLRIGTNGFYFGSTKSCVELNNDGTISFRSGNYVFRIGKNGFFASCDGGSGFFDITNTLIPK